MKRLPLIRFPVEIPDTILTDEWDDGLPLWEVQQAFAFILNGEEYEIPAGFRYNMASIPWGFRNTFNPTDPRYAAETLVHDWNCDGEFWPRADGDLVFFAGLWRRNLIPRWRQRFMYRAVRLGSMKHALTMRFNERARVRQDRKVLITRKLAGVGNGKKRPLWETLP